MKTTSRASRAGSFSSLFAGVWLGLSVSAWEVAAQSNTVIVGASLGGTLTWTTPPYLSTFTVEWAPTVTGPWSNSWSSLASIPNTGQVCSAQVPVFYRVVGRAYPGVMLHGDGTNGSAAIVDGQGHAVGVRGGTRIYTTNSHLGSGSIYFDGTGNYLDLGISPDWAFATGDFTVDLWANFSQASGIMHLIGLHQSGVYTEWSLIYQGTVLNLYINGMVAAGHTWTPIVGQWYHLAVTRSSGVLRLFVDGRLVQTASNASNVANDRNLTIGAASNPSLFFKGFLDEVHIAKGRAMWTQDFTPPTVPYDY